MRGILVPLAQSDLLVPLARWVQLVPWVMLGQVEKQEHWGGLAQREVPAPRDLRVMAGLLAP